VTEAQRYAEELRQIERAIFGRRGEGHVHPTNERMEALVDLLGDPQRAYRAVHLTGTNGKTSTARMIDELLRGFGLRAGRYTSPHLEKVTERIVVDGEPVSDRTFVDGYREIEPYIELLDGKSPVPLSFFEIVTALAYSIFADTPVEVAVVEVGMGGAWDNTNVIDAEVAVVTPIGLDHTQYLGDEVSMIAGEKAGIIKPGAVAVLAAQPEDAAAVLLRRCVEVDATVAREGLEFGVIERRLAVGGQALTVQGLGGIYDEIFLPLFGAHQAQNAALALAAVEAFLGAGAGKQLEVELVREGFAQVDSPGRLERVRSAPTILLDGAHNPHGMAATVTALEDEFSFRHLVAVLAVMADKDASGLLDLLEPVAARIVVTQNSSSRSMPADQLGQVATEIFGEDRVTVAQNMPDAIEEAVVIAEEDTSGELSGVGVLITGSVVTVADARRLLKR
jgi:dihydrofolate synthase/folylpolyglutamate synthase